MGATVASTAPRCCDGTIGRLQRGHASVTSCMTRNFDSNGPGVIHYILWVTSYMTYLLLHVIVHIYIYIYIYIFLNVYIFINVQQKYIKTNTNINIYIYIIVYIYFVCRLDSVDLQSQPARSILLQSATSPVLVLSRSKGHCEVNIGYI